MDYKVLFTKNQIENMDEEEIYKEMKRGIYHNDYKWQRDNKLKFTGKNKAEHIERLLYLCPKCKSLDSIYSHGDNFHCKSCGEKWNIDDYGFINGEFFQDTVQWNKWQKDLLYKKIKEENLEIISGEIKLKKFNSYGEKILDENVEINLSSMKIEIKINTTVEEIKIENVKAVSITLLDIFEFYNSRDEKFRIVFDPKSNPSIILFLETLKYYMRRIKDER
jgi:ribosomal protein S27AE